MFRKMLLNFSESFPKPHLENMTIPLPWMMRSGTGQQKSAVGYAVPRDVELQERRVPAQRGGQMRAAVLAGLDRKNTLQDE